MAEFFDFLTTAVGAPTGKLLMVAGLVYLGVAIVGSITGYIKPGPIGRVAGGLAGALLILVGLGMDRSASADHAPSAGVQAAPVPIATPAPTPTPTPRPVVARPTLVVPPTLLQQRNSELQTLQDIQAKYDRNAQQIIESLGR